MSFRRSIRLLELTGPRRSWIRRQDARTNTSKQLRWEDLHLFRRRPLRNCLSRVQKATSIECQSSMNRKIVLAILVCLCAPASAVAQTAVPEGMVLVPAGKFWMGREFEIFVDSGDFIAR